MILVLFTSNILIIPMLDVIVIFSVLRFILGKEVQGLVSSPIMCSGLCSTNNNKPSHIEVKVLIVGAFYA